MKKLFFFTTMLFSSMLLMAQVEVKNGPELDNDRDNRMNRMLGGDDKSFYCYRIRSAGKGTSYFVEKYSKATLKPEFSKELTMDGERRTKIEDVQYASGTVYIFIRSYDKEAKEMSLYFQSVSSDGKISAKKQEILNISSDHFEFVDFEIYQNPGKTKFLVKAFHKENREDKYKTDFILFAAGKMEKIWEKRVDGKVGGKIKPIFTFAFGPDTDNDIGFIGLHLDDNDNVYYATSYYAKNSTDKIKRYKAAVSMLEAKSEEPKTTELTFEEDYLVKDVEFSMGTNNQLVIGGFVKDVIERKGSDLVKVGIFSFTMNTVDWTIASQAVKIFDDKILTALESSAKKSKFYKYKLDYIFHVGTDVYYVGEQYSETRVSNNNQYSISSYSYVYEYMDVIVAKLNASGKFEWVKNTPLRNNLTLNDFKHVFKQYIAVATDKAIYILNNENEKNMEIYNKADFEPKDLKSMTKIHGSHFVYSTVALSDGKIKHGLIFVNEEYCFAPIQERNLQFVPPPSTEIFVWGSNANEFYIYTEDKGRDRFAKVLLK